MKKVLIIAYYWPPAGGPGVQRWLKFVSYFKEFGIEPILYVPENPHYPLIDESLLNEAPNDITIIKKPIKEPYGLAKLFSKKKTHKVSSGIISQKKASILEKLMLWVRGNFFIPDARVGWVKPSVEFLQDYLVENNLDTVITTGPPHSMHLIGLQLKQKLKLSWLADFRDPWTTIHYHKSLRLSKKSKLKHKQLEKEVLNYADSIVVTSENTKQDFLKLTNKPIYVVTNGYEENDLIPNLDTKFSLVHIGSLLSNRNPEILWQALSEIIQEHETIASDIEIKFVGVVGDEIINNIHKYQLEGFTINVGYVSHSEALQLQKNAILLLMIEMDTSETKAIIPGKLFEYLAAKRPIIALGPEGSDVVEILKETKTGDYFLYTEKEKLKEHILACYQKYKEGLLQVNSKQISKYSRKALTQAMSEILLSLK